jgi:hypothetical protein
MKEIIVIVTCLCGTPQKDTRTLAEIERSIMYKDSLINEYKKPYQKYYQQNQDLKNKLRDRKYKMDQGLIYLDLTK